MVSIAEKTQKKRAVRTKDERLEMRVKQDLKELLLQAADIQGVTLTDFIIATIFPVAQEIVRQHEALTLSREERIAFVEALLSPSTPNETLRSAAQRYKKRLGI